MPKERPIKRGVEKLKSFLSAKGLSNLMVAFVLFWVFLGVSLIFHEFGHVLTARLLGCKAGITSLNQVTGASSIDCSMFSEPLKNLKMQWIAYAGPLFAFGLGSYIWLFEGKDSLLRLLAMINWFMSCIPSLYPTMKGGDAYKAVHSFGASPVRAWVVFVVVTSVIAFFLSREISEERFPF